MNTLSLFGLVLAIGLVVDDAIVVVEAVEHHIEEGMSPRDATFKAMEEVSGPVVAIAIILAAVFIPTAFIPGITGRLYQQFALTIAISVIISAFNALSLSPALCAMLLRPKGESQGPLAGFYGWFNRLFGRVQEGYVGISRHLIQKSVVELRPPCLLRRSPRSSSARGCPSSFLPEEDQGYLYVGLQLPNAASLQRTAEAARKVEEILKNTPGVKTYTSVIGFSLLEHGRTTPTAGSSSSTSSPGPSARSPRRATDAIKAHLTRSSEDPRGRAFAFSPPSIPGIGTAGGFTSSSRTAPARTSRSFPRTSTNSWSRCKQGRRSPGCHTTFLPSVPQVFVKVDRDKVLKQGVELADVYRTLQCYMGGIFVNYFNRFGRQWQVYVEAEGEYRNSADKLGSYYVRNRDGAMVPLSALTTVETPPWARVHDAVQPLPQRADQRGGGAGLQLGPGTAALEDVFAKTMPREMGFDYLGMSYQEKKAQEGVPPAAIFGLSLLFVFLILAALYESWSLPFSVLLGVPVAVFGAYLDPLCAADGEQRLRADRPHHADRPLGQERHPDRRVRPHPLRARGPAPRGGAGGGQDPAQADPDDLVCVHPGLRAPLARQRLGRRRAQGHGDGGHRRHARGERPGDLPDSGDVLRDRDVGDQGPAAQRPRAPLHPMRRSQQPPKAADKPGTH